MVALLRSGGGVAESAADDAETSTLGRAGAEHLIIATGFSGRGSKKHTAPVHGWAG
jgi:hypothetical protein